MVHDSSPSKKGRRNSPQLSKSISFTTHVPDDEPGIAEELPKKVRSKSTSTAKKAAKKLPPDGSTPSPALIAFSVNSAFLIDDPHWRQLGSYVVTQSTGQVQRRMAP
eukprot:scaffold12451_cov65-Attheya_sp.AAC.1